MEPPNRRRVGTRSFVLYRGFLYLEVKIYWYNRNWDEYIDLSFIERCSLFGVSFIGGSSVYFPIANIVCGYTTHMMGTSPFQDSEHLREPGYNAGFGVVIHMNHHTVSHAISAGFAYCIP